jgi:hypothetical protein
MDVLALLRVKPAQKPMMSVPIIPPLCTDSYWEGVARHAQGEATSIAYTSASGEFAYLVMDSADNTTAIVVEGRSDIVAPSAGMVDEFYNDIIALHTCHQTARPQRTAGSTGAGHQAHWESVSPSWGKGLGFSGGCLSPKRPH